MLLLGSLAKLQIQLDKHLQQSYALLLQPRCSLHAITSIAPAMSEKAADLVAGNKERLRAYEEERAEAARIAGPVGGPAPSIGCMGDLASRIGTDKTPIEKGPCPLRDWLVEMQEGPPEVGCSLGPERERPFSERQAAGDGRASGAEPDLGTQQSIFASNVYIYRTQKPREK
jgi:hypothetical protein